MILQSPPLTVTVLSPLPFPGELSTSVSAFHAAVPLLLVVCPFSCGPCFVFQHSLLRLSRTLPPPPLPPVNE